MSFFSRLFRREPFAGLDADEKRELLAFDLAALKKEKSRRDGGRAIQQGLLKDVVNKDLDVLIQIRKLADKAATKRGSEAISLYKQIAELAPWDETCWLKMAEIANFIGQDNNARRWFQKARELNPDGDEVRAVGARLDGAEQLKRQKRRQGRETAIRNWIGARRFSMIGIGLGEDAHSAHKKLVELLAGFPVKCIIGLGGGGNNATITAPWENSAPSYAQAIDPGAVEVILRRYGKSVLLLSLVSQDSKKEIPDLTDEWRAFLRGM